MGGMRVLLVGGLNVDTLARTTAAPVAGTSNPGTTTRSAGGVARNVADNLRRLGDECALVGAVGGDEAGDFLLSSLEGVDTHRVRRADRTGSYTAVLDDAGELVIGVADMAATESVRAEEVEAVLSPAFDWLVLDGTLLPATVGGALEAARRHGVPVALDPVGVAKAARLGTLDVVEVHTLTPNRDELAAFTGTDDLRDGIARAHARGVRWLWLREGSAGSRLFGPDGEHEVPAHDVVVADVTGAGDAMLAGYLHALGDGAGPVDAAAYGAATAALTIASPAAVRPDLSDALVRRTLAECRTR
jgi:pseudouridine kinase